MKHMFDTSETVGDEILQAVLSEGSDTSMKSIVATIQKEQNWIIRDEKHKLLVVQGAAGSGKHRRHCNGSPICSTAFGRRSVRIRSFSFPRIRF